MCVTDISKPRVYDKVFYKVVVKKGDEYYSPIAGTKLGKLGETVFSDKVDLFKSRVPGFGVAYRNNDQEGYFSVFQYYEDAKKIKSSMLYNLFEFNLWDGDKDIEIVILKVSRLPRKRWFEGTEPLTMNRYSAALINPMKLEEEL